MSRLYVCSRFVCLLMVCSLISLVMPLSVGAASPAPMPTDLRITGQTNNSITWVWAEADSTAYITAYDGAVHALAPGTTTYTQSGIANGGYGCLTVAAYNAVGPSGFTPYICGLVIPLTPTGLHLTGTTTSSVSFGWTNADPFSYEGVYDGAAWHPLDQNATSYTAPVAAGYFACETVVAYNASYASPFSPYVCGLAKPAMPINVQVTDRTLTSVTFSWTNQDPYSGIALSNDGVHLINLGINATTYTAHGVFPVLQPACISMASYNASGASGYTAWVCGTSLIQVGGPHK